MTVTLPLLYTGSYLKRTPGVGNLYVGSYAAASGGGTVFDDLVNPPATGVTAETSSLAWAQAKGSTSTVSTVHGKPWYTAVDVTKLATHNMDWVMRFYLEASISRVGGVPVF
jgi:hypothetical protein